MNCPECKNNDSRVLDTRVHKNDDIRRRRECLECKARFSTIESVIRQYPHIEKKNGCYEPFNKEKLLRGIQLACMKRPVSLSQIESLVDQLIKKIQQEKSIKTENIGKLVMEELRSIDDVAYVRFASVYKDFKDIGEFVEACQDVN